jgi:hypothetical protein
MENAGTRGSTTRTSTGVAGSALVAVALVFAGASGAAAGVQGKTHLGGKASGMISLFASAFPGADPASFDVIAKDGTHAAFAMPPKTVLVVTDALVRTINSASSGRVRGSISVPGGTVGSMVFDFDTSQQKTQHLPLVAGTVMGAPPQVTAEAGTVTALVFLYGYLAADK